eukprot:2713301-Lingulodinium_polyedra.AAC.1
MHDHARPCSTRNGQGQTARPGKGPARHAGRLEEWPQDGAAAGRHPPTNDGDSRWAQIRANGSRRGTTGGERSPRRANRTPDQRLAPYWNRGKRALLRIGNPAE